MPSAPRSSIKSRQPKNVVSASKYKASQPHHVLKLALQYNIREPEETETLLLDAGFSVGVRDTKFVVSLNTRTVSRSEVAEVLGCKVEQLSLAKDGVIIG